MDRRDENRISMISTVCAHLLAHRGLWAHVPATTRAIEELTALNTSITAASAIQGMVTTGITGAKTMERERLENEMMEVADALGAMADERQAPEIGAQVNFTLTTVTRWSEADLKSAAQRVLDLGLGQAELLKSDYDLGKDDLSELATALENYAKAATRPRQAISERAVQTEALPGLVRAATLLLDNRIDRQINRLRRKEPEFYAAYRRARIIVDYGMGGQKDEAGAGEAPTAG